MHHLHHLRRATLALTTVFVSGYLVLAVTLPLDVWATSDPVTPRTLPIIYATLALITLVALAIKDQLAISQSSSDVTSSSGGGKGWLRAAGLIGALCAFAFMLDLVGLWFGTGILLLTLLLVMGEGRLRVLLGAPLLLALSGWLLVEIALGIYIPTPAVLAWLASG